ncbi:TraR/DksA family transcriptional regulator [Pseudoalteromonas tunicata]|jgi:RNA polymerase-binding transcription factor DksA|uniref:Uncharacterized protein n=1 Tax=Pseudoalteromonas tunicata D2 TaxID=87626 RepID=A4CBE2_9GAMM|nr:TraR/DksA C4-type zinc finger protein [Pseudoalteromonas tunicata]ATC94235.1 hypothetical protein PTUN_a1629 [Pseudoalteromonas tunicata]AXT29989.1 TraR/DksA family transcriptional regulator [Pseudoalteromonas tunicata]EAR27679.1 hypothetical protein PTD2_17695 [Pseudoalteromonas tunicata D2]MDP4983806.1 TraR/DksA C4-type zinc finger protein [Pseudoalteromonas tunicata]MDP5211461.1 TraR/DksA C4-type zinc finger protein [Pseudoalteromonas tunicata]
MANDTLLLKLEQQQAELINRINAIENDFKQGRSADFAEYVSETENDQVLNTIRNEAKSELQLVNQAIENLHQGHYGVCQQCLKAIAPARLEALPYTQTCIDCA